MSPERLARRVEAVREDWRVAGKGTGVALVLGSKSEWSLRWPSVLW